MRQFIENALAGIALTALLVPAAIAQPIQMPQNFSVRTMSFELWCQDTQRYPAERCMQRRPEDVKAFEDYRAVIERYELQYLKQEQKQRDEKSFSTRDPSQTIFDKQDGSLR